MCVDGPELEDGLRSRCPRLKQLVLDTITLQGGAHIRSISIRSHSLERLTITAPSQLQGCFEIDTPELQAFCPRNVSGFYIAAPKLLEVDWSINYFYYSSRQCFAENGRYLQRLVVSANYPGFLMMQRFETVKELELIVCIKKGVQEYRRFLEVINKVAKCEVLVVKIMKVEHAYRPMLLHHLGKCPELRKVVVQFGSHKDDYPCESYSGCPCSWLENRKTNYLVLNSLEQVAIEDPDDYGNAADKVDLVRLFGKISARCEKRVSITVSERCKATREKISSICPPNDKVEILVRST